MVANNVRYMICDQVLFPYILIFFSPTIHRVNSFVYTFLDVTKLVGIVEDQQKYMEQLRREIKMLKTKGLCPTPMGTETPETGIKKEEISRVWDLEKYLEEEEAIKAWEAEGEAGYKDDEEIQKFFKREITIPGL